MSREVYVWNGVSPSSDHPNSQCGPTNNTTPAVSVCTDGDSCLSGGICSYTHSMNGGSGYYASGCTDASFPGSPDGACARLCQDQYLPDVVYVKSSGLWACCTFTSSGGVDCSNPSNETFNRPPPEELFTYFQIPATGYIYTSTSSSTPITSSATSTSPVSSTPPVISTDNATPGPSGLSSGAAAGIGVGVAAAVIITLTVLVLLWRAGRRRTREQGIPTTSTNPTQYAWGDMPTSLGNERRELAADHMPQTLQTHQFHAYKESSSSRSPGELAA
ncbi:hypothetical protein F5B18DRAFT_615477 [Nemania serpens]|nr:hypothetical protein F5B18DRAFT_615477 [Nemania serpens]